MVWTRVRSDSNALIGRGRLAEGLSAILDGTDPGVVLAVSDAPHLTVVDVARARARPVLPVLAEIGYVRVGPLEQPSEPGCADCLRLRRHRAAARSAERAAVWTRHEESLAKAVSPWLTATALDVVAAIVADEISRLNAPCRTPRTRNGILLIDLADLTVRPHSLLPDPLCPYCGWLPADTPEQAHITLVSRPKPAPDQHRVWDAEREFDRLARIYVDDHTGVVNSVNRDALGSLAVAGAPIRLRGTIAFEPGFGRSCSYRRSSAIALLEALERYGAVSPGGRHSAVRASFAEIADTAVDPRLLGLHPPENYALPEFPYRPFSTDAVCRWLWGYSFAKGAPVFVPERNVHYGQSNDDQPFCYELANGCALGSCLEEAVFHGILEVLERDAFLLTWYTRARAPRIDLGTARDTEVALRAAAITVENGYTVECYDITPDHGVPCVWALARTESAEPSTISAAAAGTSLERAAEGALAELGPMIPTVRDHFPTHAQRARKLAADGRQVRSMVDHYLVYGVAEAARRLSFLTETTERAVFTPTYPGFNHADLTSDLHALIDRLAAVGLDVVVVDLTTPEHRAGDLRCVKVLVPGAIPMTFGEQNRRTWGLPRLLDPAAVHGRGARVRDHADLNPDPHPFP